MDFVGDTRGLECKGRTGVDHFGCPASHPLGHPLISATATVDVLGELSLLLTASPLKHRECVILLSILALSSKPQRSVWLAWLHAAQKFGELVALGQPSTAKYGSHWLDVPPSRALVRG